ncbi:glutaminyl-peptide cyclotransferase [Streptomyces sp. TE4109]
MHKCPQGPAPGSQYRHARDMQWGIRTLPRARISHAPCPAAVLGVRLRRRPPRRHKDGAPVRGINELECAPDSTVRTNVPPASTIVRLDPATGTVTATAAMAWLGGRTRRPPRPHRP